MQFMRDARIAKINDEDAKGGREGNREGGQHIGNGKRCQTGRMA